MVMKARQKPLAVSPLAELGVETAPRLSVEKVSPPPERQAGRVVASVADLAIAIKAELAEMEASR